MMGPQNTVLASDPQGCLKKQQLSANHRGSRELDPVLSRFVF